jgi:hypothetical protein
LAIIRSRLMTATTARILGSTEAPRWPSCASVLLSLRDIGFSSVHAGRNPRPLKQSLALNYAEIVNCVCGFAEAVDLRRAQ